MVRLVKRYFDVTVWHDVTDDKPTLRQSVFVRFIVADETKLSMIPSPAISC